MPRKTRRLDPGPHRRPRSFNEAAARCRGKHTARAPDQPPLRRASMRPRPDAAENGDDGVQAEPLVPASMRPRPDAAENPPFVRLWSARPPCFNEAAARCRGKRRRRLMRLLAAAGASMRPRPDAAENKLSGGRPGPCAPASMRPRPDAAENRQRGTAVRNEGPAASMRPRPDAAENRRGRGLAGHRHSASMRPRPDAAENPRGARARRRRARASMRPRPDAAENGRALAGAVHAPGASMRPRPDAAENATTAMRGSPP